MYAVVVPAGVANNQSGVIGEHSYYWFSSGGTTTNVPYAWVTHNGLDDFSEVFSHELVEAATDPEGTGWTSTTACGTGHGGWCEIGDVCQGSTARVHGVLVQRYFSNRDNQCVVPDDPKVATDNKQTKDSKDSKDHKDHKDHKELKEGAKEKDGPKEIKDGAKEKDHEVPFSTPDLVEQLRQLATQLQSVVGLLTEPGSAEAFISPEQRPHVGP